MINDVWIKVPVKYYTYLGSLNHYYIIITQQLPWILPLIHVISLLYQDLQLVLPDCLGHRWTSIVIVTTFQLSPFPFLLLLSVLVLELIVIIIIILFLFTIIIIILFIIIIIIIIIIVLLEFHFQKWGRSNRRKL